MRCREKQRNEGVQKRSLRKGVVAVAYEPLIACGWVLMLCSLAKKMFATKQDDKEEPKPAEKELPTWMWVIAVVLAIVAFAVGIYFNE